MWVPSWFQSEEEDKVLNKKRSKKTQKKYDERKKIAKVEATLEEQFSAGRLLGKSISKGGGIDSTADTMKTFGLSPDRG